MIHPRQAWCVQIDLTNNCFLHCSNCTRLLDHRTKDTAYYMPLDCFEKAVIAVKDFLIKSEDHPSKRLRGRRKVIGLIGGEPTLHPRFPEVVDIMCQYIPNAYHRGLWTSKDWRVDKNPKWGPLKPQVEKLLGGYDPHDSHNTDGPSHKHKFGYLNWNMHTEALNCHHQPMLVAVKDVMLSNRHIRETAEKMADGGNPDDFMAAARLQCERRMWEMIEKCWVQDEWSPSITDKGFFFCEVAAAFDKIMKGPGGMPLTPEMWKGDIKFVRDENSIPQPTGPYAEQIKHSCVRCSACLPLAGRRDSQDRDDISPSNFVALEALGSPRIKKGDYEIFDPEQVTYDESKHNVNWEPQKYVKAVQADGSLKGTWAAGEAPR